MVLLKLIFSMSKGVRGQVPLKLSEVIPQWKCLNGEGELVMDVLVTPCASGERVRYVMVSCGGRLK